MASNIMAIRTSIKAQRDIPKTIFNGRITLPPKYFGFKRRDNFCYRFTMHGNGDHSASFGLSNCDCYFNLYTNPYVKSFNNVWVTSSRNLEELKWDLVGMMEVSRGYLINEKWTYKFITLKEFKSKIKMPTNELNKLCKEIVEQQAESQNADIDYFAKILTYKLHP